jgi:hypothetical protein
MRSGRVPQGPSCGALSGDSLLLEEEPWAPPSLGRPLAVSPVTGGSSESESLDALAGGAYPGGAYPGAPLVAPSVTASKHTPLGTRTRFKETSKGSNNV